MYTQEELQLYLFWVQQTETLWQRSEQAYTLWSAQATRYDDKYCEMFCRGLSEVV
jgi:hypothetical protein